MHKVISFHAKYQLLGTKNTATAQILNSTSRRPNKVTRAAASTCAIRAAPHGVALIVVVRWGARPLLDNLVGIVAVNHNIDALKRAIAYAARRADVANILMVVGIDVTDGGGDVL